MWENFSVTKKYKKLMITFVFSPYHGEDTEDKIPFSKARYGLGY